MDLRVLVLIFTTVFTNFVACDALNCHSCRDSSCFEEDIPKVECSCNVTKLPHNFKSRTFDLEIVEYACLDLEYVEDKKVFPVRQCYVVQKEEEITSSLPVSVQLNKCEVQRNSPDDVEYVDYVEEFSGSSTLSTDPTETVSDNPTTSSDTSSSDITTTSSKTTTTTSSGTTTTTPDTGTSVESESTTSTESSTPSDGGGIALATISLFIFILSLTIQIIL